MSEDKKTRIEQIEELLNRKEMSWEDNREITILPNGEIVIDSTGEPPNTGTLKPLTFRENLGGEYGI
jgi:hypothetical protein